MDPLVRVGAAGVEWAAAGLRGRRHDRLRPARMTSFAHPRILIR